MARPLKLPNGRVVNVPDDATPDDIDEIVTQFMADTPEPVSQPEAKTASSSWQDYLPMAGGAVGGLLGGSKASPVGMALAGIGGAGGEAWKQVADAVRGDFSEVPETMVGRLKKIGTEGLTQAGFEGGGRLVGAALRPVAKTIYGLALRPSRAITRNLGGGKVLEGTKRVIEQGFDDSVLPSSLGVGRAERLLTQSADEATRLAAASPKREVTRRVLHRAEADQARRMLGEMSSGVTPHAAPMAEQITTAIRTNPPQLTMSQLLELRRASEKIARPAFAAAKIPGGTPVVPGTKAAVARSIAGSAKRSLEDALGDAFTKVNRRTQSRAALRQAVEEAAARPHMLQNLLAGGAGIATSDDPMEALKKAALLRMLMSPTTYGSGALALGKAPYAQLFRAADAAGVPLRSLMPGEP